MQPTLSTAAPQAPASGIAVSYRNFYNPTTTPGTGTAATDWVPTDGFFDLIPNCKTDISNDGSIDTFRLHANCRMFHVVDNFENYAFSYRSEPFEQSNIEIIYLSSSSGDPINHIQVSPGGTYTYIYSDVADGHFLFIKNKLFSTRGSKNITISQYAGSKVALPFPQ